MRAALVAAILAPVLGASALNLALGAIWVGALTALNLLLRRRGRFASAVVLVLVVAAAVAGSRLGWFAPPPPISYAVGEVTWLADRFRFSRGSESSGDQGSRSHSEAVRARLAARREEEARYADADFERRAAAAVALARALPPLRGRAPEEVARVEDAARRLAVTLTAPEFRDLNGRRRRLESWLSAIEDRLSAARDEAELDALARALDPAVMALVSFRALSEDLLRVDRATVGLLRALTGRDLAVALDATLEYDEERGEVVAEHRYAFAVAAPLRIAGLDVTRLRRPGRRQWLGFEVPGTALQEVGGGSGIELGAGAERVVIVDREREPATVRPVRSALKWLPFQRLRLPPPPAGPREFLLTVTLRAVGGADALVAVARPVAPLPRIGVPRYALHYVSAPGAVGAAEGRDVWLPGTAESGSRGPDGVEAVAVELVPRSMALRNPLFAALRPYLYRPNVAALLALTGLAALTRGLVPRRRRTKPPPG